MIEWAGIALICAFLTVTGFVIGYMIRRSDPKPMGKRACKHGGGFCKDYEEFKVCSDDPTRKVACWSAGVFEDDPLQHGIQVDLDGERWGEESFAL